jgi:predicted GIY-YIG superfamily endonuclease
MEFYCYIIFSKSINRYYVGYTSNLDERLQMHRSGYFGTKSYYNESKRLGNLSIFSMHNYRKSN